MSDFARQDPYPVLLRRLGLLAPKDFIPNAVELALRDGPVASAAERTLVEDLGEGEAEAAIMQAAYVRHARHENSR